MNKNSRAKQISPSTSDKPDPFSLLADDILVYIISRIDDCTTKELIGTTATISKRWRNLWASVPRLIFDELDEHWDSIHYTSSDLQSFISFMKNIINQGHTSPNLKLFSFHANYDPDLNPEFESQFNSWIRYAISRNVEEFDLMLWIQGEGEFGEFTYYDELFFNSPCITRIKLSWCLFNPPKCGIRWEKLESLYIFRGFLDQDTLDMILSGSPRLETLVLEDCYGYRRIDITSKSVKTLELSGYDFLGHPDETIDRVEIKAPYISSLTIEGYLVLQELALLDVSSLDEANLDYSIGWMEYEEEIFRGLFESLKHVDIKFGDQLTEIRSRLEASNDTSNDDHGDQEEDSD